jgi:hypothetical protein
VANQQKDIAPEIVAAKELLLEKLILLCSERSWEPLGGTRNILAADQTSEIGELFGPSQLVKQGAMSRLI